MGDVSCAAIDARAVAVVAASDAVDCVVFVLLAKFLDAVQVVAVTAALLSGVSVSSVVLLLAKAKLIGIKVYAIVALVLFGTSVALFYAL